MKKGIVSIVVPIYNVEKYLDRCIESIVNQTYRNLEIILVDDGSPDNCPQMCDEWAKRDNRIKVVHKQNAGLGMARNTGIEQATGEYICFFDSDDYIEAETIENAYRSAVQNDADVVCFGVNYINTAGEKTGTRIPREQKAYRGEDVQKEYLPNLVGPDPKTGDDYGLSMTAWSKMFSMQSVQSNNWRFVSERQIQSEDVYSLLEWYGDVKTVFVLPHAYYNYCQNNMSVSRSYRPDRFGKICYFYAETKKLCYALGYTQETIDRIYGVYLSFVIAAMKQEIAAENSARFKKKALRDILANEELQCTLKKTKNDKVAIKKKVLFWAMRHQWTDLCYVLLLAQNAVA